METEVIDKLFLELSQVTKATTKRELDLQAKIEAMSLPDEVVDLRLLLDCRKDAERMQKEIERLREALEDACLTFSQYGEQPPQKWLTALAKEDK